MKVLFLPWGQPTHYFHMVPLAWAFRAAGHDVRVAGQPGTADAVKNSGLTISSIGHSYDSQPDASQLSQASGEHLRALAPLLAQDRRNPEAGRSVLSAGHMRQAMTDQTLRRSPQEKLAPYTQSAEAMAAELAELARGWRPDLVIADPFVLAAPLAVPQGATLVHNMWGPALHRRAGVFPGSGMPVELWPDDLQRLFDTFGVEARAEHAAGTIDNCPASIQYPLIPDRIPARFVPYNGPGDAPAWLLEPPARPRICVTWGTLTTTTTGPEGFLVPRILQALADLDADIEIIVTVTAADRALLPDPAPKNVRIIKQLPLHLLLPSCAAVIHQGGGGTMLTAVAQGVPQVMAYGMIGQAANAQRLMRTGAGVALDWADASADAITAAVTTVLDDSHRQAATRLHDENQAQPAPADVARQLAALC